MTSTSLCRMLVVFDVDSTLIQDEVIELLADCAGKRAEVSEVTERAMRGELDFTGSLKARVISLKGLPDTVIQDTLEKITITKGAKELIQAIHSAGGKVAAVSGGFTQLLEPLARELNLDYYRANQLEILDGNLTGLVTGPIIDKPAKAQALTEWAKELGLSLQRTIAVGDGANDLDMMHIAGLSIGFNAKPRVRKAADILIFSNDLSEAIGLLGL
ncbi:MAG: phosphoserine phosphatase SerB [Micrococcales bacterium]|nr:phosphoserine phosphatase SerB [Actinomycetota bacterium]NCA07343.1 phosphoserine phosphatase SerB [Micrococcales bacterium]